MQCSQTTKRVTSLSPRLVGRSRRPRVLLVEDDPALNEALREPLVLDAVIDALEG